jgi:hypothetical protein
MVKTTSRRWDLKGRKATYTCPLCKTEHVGFATWRHHVYTKHENKDPRYPPDVSDACHAVDNPETEDLFFCTWPDCEKNFTTIDNLYSHFATTHKVNLVSGKATKGSSALSQELGYEFENYLEKHRRFEEEYPESA